MVACSFHSEREQGYRSSGLSGDEDGIDGKKKKKKKGLLFDFNGLIFYMYIVITMAELTSSLIKPNNNRYMYIYSLMINTFMKNKYTSLMISSMIINFFCNHSYV